MRRTRTWVVSSTKDRCFDVCVLTRPAALGGGGTFELIVSWLAGFLN